LTSPKLKVLYKHILPDSTVLKAPNILKKQKTRKHHFTLISQNLNASSGDGELSVLIKRLIKNIFILISSAQEHGDGSHVSFWEKPIKIQNGF
jgi:hypothetical protein